MYENPSAGKFDPPPDPEEERSRRRKNRLILVLGILSSYPIVQWFLPERVSGWLAWVAVAAVFALTVVRGVLEFTRDEEIRGGPYTRRTNITR